MRGGRPWWWWVCRACVVVHAINHQAGIVTKEIAADDEEGFPILERHLPAVRAFVGSAREAGGACLVHCVAGINRSGVLVAATHLLEQRSAVLHAVAHCRRQRGSCFLWNESFQEQLVALARREGRRTVLCVWVCSHRVPAARAGKALATQRTARFCAHFVHRREGVRGCSHRSLR